MYTGKPPTYEQSRIDNVTQVFDEYNITGHNAENMVSMLGNYDIVLLCDDSSSMTTRDGQTESGETVTRWQELKDKVGKIAKIGSALDKNGIDVHFLNRKESILNLHDIADGRLEKAFAREPQAFDLTPLSDATERVLRAQDPREKTQKGKAKPILLIVATDGVPVSNDADSEKRWHEIIEKAVKKNPITKKLEYTGKRDVRVSILACTNEKDVLESLNKLDGKSKKIDVCDDYRSEKEEILKINPNQSFSVGDYLVKCMMAPIDPKLDALDEVQEQGSSSALKSVKKFFSR